MTTALKEPGRRPVGGHHSDTERPGSMLAPTINGNCAGRAGGIQAIPFPASLLHPRDHCLLLDLGTTLDVGE
jgi:hypothetical protein